MFKVFQRAYHRRVVYKSWNGATTGSGSANVINMLSTPRGKRNLALFVGGSTVFYLTNLHEAPVSKRTRFLWIPRSWELKIGDYSYNSMMSQVQNKILPTSHPEHKRVARIFHRLVEAAQNDAQDPEVREQLKDLNWQIHVINDPHQPPNAFVMPGGKVFVFTSILPICANDDGLATVLAHEFSHQLARHSAENLSKSPFYSILGLTLYGLTGMSVFNRLLMDACLRMPASRQMETEADYIGLMIMSRACYNPNESIKLWQRMANYEKSVSGYAGNVEFLSTHPSSANRIENMRQWMPQADAIYEQSDCGMFKSFNTIPKPFGLPF
ncbi:metalloendopeptidase [Hanseniaspora osmophila]|uniref:Mitochondrial metalloendopeptidase OMA1 n=1 Tax=Hanseniaspora osmophila TaxID=56408 RepID=A0A1E5R5I1_9ASCO|nr:Mitochondrial metalloendopeptidase OMA1 [Hanseniaspora osmophila]